MEKLDTKRAFDGLIKEALESKAQEAVNPAFLLEKINREIRNREEENQTMNKEKRLRGIKPLAVAMLIVVVTAATSFAATHMGGYLLSSTKDSFEKLPTERQMEKAVGYVPDYLESFSNGFYFKDASVVNTEAFDDAKSKKGEYDGIHFNYTKKNALREQTLSLSADPVNPSLEREEVGKNEEVITIDGLELIYSKVTFKVAPVGYVPTAEEQEKVAKEEMWISEGSDEVEVSELQYVRWIKDEVSYNLMEDGWGLEKEELLKMAEEVINSR